MSALRAVLRTAKVAALAVVAQEAAKATKTALPRVGRALGVQARRVRERLR